MEAWAKYCETRRRPVTRSCRCGRDHEGARQQLRLQKIWDDPDRLETWTLEQLEALDMEHDWFLGEVDERRDWSLITTSAHTQWAWRLDRAKAAARQGKLNPLRRLYPRSRSLFTRHGASGACTAWWWIGGVHTSGCNSPSMT